ncbi:MAG: hypothetical protein ABTQ32_22915 [Myxococcaceae bacterium]
MRSLLLCLLGCLGGCATTPQVLFTSFGSANPAGDAEVVSTFKSDRALLVKTAKNPEARVTLKNGREVTMREFAQKRIDATRRVEVLVDTVPAGLELREGGAVTSEGSGLVLLGRFTLRYPAPVSLQHAVDDVKVLTQAADGSIAVVSWSRASQTETSGAAGLILRANEALDPKTFKSGKVQEL